jgi:hypothetical protein
MNHHELTIDEFDALAEQCRVFEGEAKSNPAYQSIHIVDCAILIHALDIDELRELVVLCKQKGYNLEVVSLLGPVCNL